jgi:histidyl-tRNA synthetase
MADSMKVGGGGRYKKLVNKLASEGAKDPRALAAYIGRKKYGKAKFQEMAAKGK